MDLLTSCHNLYDELVYLVEEIKKLETELDNAKTLHVYEELYGKEFEYALRIVGAYDDIMYALEKLSKEDPNSAFFVKRMTDNVNKLVQTETVYVTDDV